MLEMPSRVETYATCLPSGDQMGAFSGNVSLVIGMPLPLASSITQMSPLPVCGSLRITTVRVPSGDRCGWL